MRPTVGGCDDETHVQCAEIEPAVESIGKSREVLACVLSESECMVTPAQAGLEITQHGVDPLEFGQVLGLLCANDGGSMRAFGLFDGGKAR